MYPKNKILEYNEFSEYQDVLAVLLDDGKLYSIEEAQTILDNFLNKEVD